MPTNNGGRRSVTPMVVTGSSLPLSFRSSMTRERVTRVTAVKCENEKRVDIGIRTIRRIFENELN